jgi:hypothetical protein
MEHLKTPLVLLSSSSSDMWQGFQAKVLKDNDMGFHANVRFIQDPDLIGASHDLLRKTLKSDEISLILAADQETLNHPDLPVICIDAEGRSPSFRTPVRDLWVVENNVSIGNILFEEFVADQVEDGWLVSQEF